MAGAGEEEARLHGMAEAEAEADTSTEDEPEHRLAYSPGEEEDEPAPSSSSRSLPFTTASEMSFRSSSLSASDISFRSSVDDVELEDDDMMYRLMQSEYEEIPSFRYIPSSLRWWKTKRSRRRTHPSNRSDTHPSKRSDASSGLSNGSEKPPPAAAARGGEAGNDLVHLDGQAAYTMSDLLVASAVLLGKGSYGTTYGVTFEDGKQVAVKRLDVAARVLTREEFRTQANKLARIRHPNLLALRAYFYSHDENLLVFDYMPKGNLSTFLHAGGVDWPTRMNIAIGIARGLHYLHTEGKMTHGKLTGQNVLLDDRINVKISDYEIYKFRTPTSATEPARATVKEARYRAPDLNDVMGANIRTDVYSLGVIVIEIITGKSPKEEIDGQDLLRWVSSAAEEGRTHAVFDEELLRHAGGTVRDELHDTLSLALGCVVPLPQAKPRVLEVLQQLEHIKQGTTRGIGAAVPKGGDEPTDEGGGTSGTPSSKSPIRGTDVAPSSSLDMAEERTVPPFEVAWLGASQTSNVLAKDENIIPSASVSPAPHAEAMPMPTNSCHDEVEEVSTLTLRGDLKEGKTISTPAPPDEIVRDRLGSEEEQVPCELGDVEPTASASSQTRDFSTNLSITGQPEEDEEELFSIFGTDEFLVVRQARSNENAKEGRQPLSTASDHRTEESISAEGSIATTCGAVPVSPQPRIDWEEVTLEARLEVPTSPPLITSEPDQGYQRYFQTLYDLAHRSPPLTCAVLEVQLNRMVMGLQSLGYPVDAWLKAATLMLVSAEKREYIERHVGDYKVHVESQLAEFASVMAPVTEEISRTRSDKATLEQEQEELDETIAKLEDQLVMTKARRKEVAGSLAIAQDRLAVAEANIESVSADMDCLDRQYSAIPDWRSAMLHELPSLDEVFDSSFREIMTRKF